ncbi:MAG: sulfatase-like hydrolase/transferase [Pirellulales bacterium]
MKRFTIAALAVLAVFLNVVAARAAERPNVLFIFSDDQRADTIAALGNEHLRTPNLDRLVANGTAMRRAYCMGALQGAVCVPSRAMLLTGRTLFRINPDMEGQSTWPEQFAAAGYTTFITGKWHNQSPSLVRAFDQGKAVFLGGMGQPYALPVQDFGPDDKLLNKRLSTKHSVELFTDCAVEFIQRQSDDKPFLAYLPLNLPHDPRLAPPEYHERHNAAKPPLPPNYLPQHPFNNGQMAGRDEELAPWPRTPEVVRQHLADYYSAIEFVDAQVGRLLNALEKSGQYERTIVVFAGDHGLAIGSHGLFGKQNLYEHSMRAPLIFAGPGIRRGEKSDALCYLLDIFPTLGELAGITPPEGSEGKSLVPVLKGEGTTHRDSIFTAYRTVQRAVTDGRWKLLVFPRINKTQLFDLQGDPHETKDLAAEAAHQRTLKRLVMLLQESQERYGDQQPLTTDKPLPLEFDFSKVKRKALPKKGD